MSTDAQPTVQSLDADIIYLQKEVNVLSSRKAALKTSVLSHPGAISRLRADAAPRQREQLDQLIADQRQGNDVGAYRLCIGVTLFNPNSDGSLKTSLHQLESQSIEKGQMIGVRLERYDKREQKLLNPAYIVLEPRDDADYGGHRQDISPEPDELLRLLDRPLQVMQHNLPVEIPLTAIEERYLSEQAYKDDNGEVVGASDMDALPSRPLSRQAQFRNFVLEVQKCLTASARRHEDLQMLVEETKWSQSINQNYVSTTQQARPITLDAREVEVVWRNGYVGRIRTDDTDAITYASVVRDDGNPDEAAEALVLQRHSLLELDTLEL